jgi:hypothetical protein
VDGTNFRNINLNDEWKIEQNSVDRLIGMMIVEHLFNPFHSFSEISRVLSPGGTAYINLPLVTNLKNRFRLLFGNLPQTSRPIDIWFENREWDGGHLHYFSLRGIERLAQASGLKVEKVSGVGPLCRLKSIFPGILAGEITFTLKKLK